MEQSEHVLEENNVNATLRLVIGRDPHVCRGVDPSNEQATAVSDLVYPFFIFLIDAKDSQETAHHGPAARVRHTIQTLSGRDGPAYPTIPCLEQRVGKVQGQL